MAALPQGPKSVNSYRPHDHRTTALHRQIRSRHALVEHDPLVRLSRHYHPDLSGHNGDMRLLARLEDIWSARRVRLPDLLGSVAAVFRGNAAQSLFVGRNRANHTANRAGRGKKRPMAIPTEFSVIDLAAGLGALFHLLSDFHHCHDGGIHYLVA